MANYYVTNSAAREKVLRRFSMFDGAGLDLTSCESYDEAIECAGIDYSAEKKEIFLENGYKIPDKYAIVRSDDENCVLGVAGSQYTPISNKDAFDLAGELFNEGKFRFEVGGPSIGTKNAVDYARTFIVMKGEDIEVNDDTYNTFAVFNNSFDGSSGIKYSIICQRVACLNGMIRYLGGKKSQLYVNIQHSKTAESRIAQAHKLVINYNHELEMIRREISLFSNERLTKTQFENEIIPLVIKAKNLGKKSIEEASNSEMEKIDTIVSSLLQAYNADDVQNYENSAYRAILALSDYETHAEPLRNTGNGHVYMNRILRGMTLTTMVAQYLANKYNISAM